MSKSWKRVSLDGATVLMRTLVAKLPACMRQHVDVNIFAIIGDRFDRSSVRLTTPEYGVALVVRFHALLKIGEVGVEPRGDRQDDDMATASMAYAELQLFKTVESCDHPLCDTGMTGQGPEPLHKEKPEYSRGKRVRGEP